VPDYPSPALTLAYVKARVLAGSWHIRREAQLSALAISTPAISVQACLLNLTPSDFHKSMDAEEPQWAGCRQDVYKPTFDGFALYVKFQKWPLDKDLLYVVSFKEQ
jgi:MqsR (Motility quorum-sensing regulator) toxin of toxin-antitoxin system